MVLWFNNEIQKTGLIKLLMQSEENIMKIALFQASAAKQMRTALFWVVTQLVMLIHCRSSGTTYRAYLQGSKVKSS
jgi:hypothetical protein